MAINCDRSPTVCAVILAAGFSRRFGSDKLLSTFDGKSILQCSTESAPSSSVSRVAVVVPEDSELVYHIPASVSMITNMERREGVSTSIAAGVKFFRSFADGILFLVADQPLIDSETLERLLSIFREHPSCIIASSVGGDIRNPMVFPSRFFGRLTLLSGDTGAKTIALSSIQDVIKVEVDPNKLVDIDTVEDLKRLNSMFKK